MVLRDSSGIISIRRALQHQVPARAFRMNVHATTKAVTRGVYMILPAILSTLRNRVGYREQNYSFRKDDKTFVPVDQFAQFEESLVSSFGEGGNFSKINLYKK